MSEAGVFNRLEKRKTVGEHSLTPVVLNRVLRQVFRQGLAVTLGLWIPFVALSIGAVAGFAQERSAAADSGAGSISGQVKAITGQGQTNVLSGIEVTLSGAPLDSSRSPTTHQQTH